MFDLNNVKNVALVSIATFILGWGSGFYVKAQFYKADKLDTVIEAKVETANNITESIDRSAKVETEVRAGEQRVAVIRKTVAKRIQEKEKTSEPQTKMPSNPVCTLDVGTVSLLNAARDGTSSVRPDSYINAESQAPSSVGVAELIDNDLEVVQLYQELAIRHNDLVDQVREFLNKQQGK